MAGDRPGLPTDGRPLPAGYVESIGDRYLVISLIPPLGGVTEVETLADAVSAVEGLREGARRTPESR